MEVLLVTPLVGVDVVEPAGVVDVVEPVGALVLLTAGALVLEVVDGTVAVPQPATNAAATANGAPSRSARPAQRVP